MSATTFTGKGIDVLRLLHAKSAVRMEKSGLKMVRWSVRRQFAKELGLKQNATHDQVIAAIDMRLAEITPQAIAEGGIQ